jgi:hypothetical protein
MEESILVLNGECSFSSYRNKSATKVALKLNQSMKRQKVALLDEIIVVSVTVKSTAAVLCYELNPAVISYQCLKASKIFEL